MQWLFGLLLVVLAVGMAACGGDGDGGDDGTADDAGAAVEAISNYWNARVEQDEEALYQYTCAARESRVPGELQSFASVQNLRLEDFACRQTGSDGDDLIVTCEGMIVADYGAGDTNEFPLRSYRMIQENSEWKYCGEAADPEEGS